MAEKEEKQVTNDTLTPIRFHFYSLKFTPYKGLNKSSVNILVDIITYLTKEMQNGKGHLIDRHQDRFNEESRELFMTSAVFMHLEKRIRCSLAVLRTGRTPMLKPADKFTLIPLEKHQGEIAEQTHFYIDYSRGFLVLCVEFNNHGPRIPDIEYYLRNVARDKLKLSKATEVDLFMDTSIDKTLAELKNVLKMDIKIQPKKFVQMDKDIVGEYFTGLNNLGNTLKPKYFNLETSFMTPGKAIKSSQINTEANKMVLNLIRKFKTRPFNVDCFDGFVVRYEDKEGVEQIFNLLKGKKEVIKEIDLKVHRNGRQWYELIEPDFNNFMENLNHAG